MIRALAPEPGFVPAAAKAIGQASCAIGAMPAPADAPAPGAGDAPDGATNTVN